MRILAHLLIACALVAGPAVTTAEAVSVRDLVDLNRAGLTDDVLIALMESDASVFHLNATDIRSLHDLGLSDKVIVAMLNTSRRSRPASSTGPASKDIAPTVAPEVPPAPEPPSAFVDNSPVFYVGGSLPPIVVNQTVTQTIESPQAPAYPVYVAVPVYMPTYTTPPSVHMTMRAGVPGQVPMSPRIVPEAPRLTVDVQKPEPVYWGWGGQKRPDSWKDKN